MQTGTRYILVALRCAMVDGLMLPEGKADEFVARLFVCVVFGRAAFVRGRVSVSRLRVSVCPYPVLRMFAITSDHFTLRIFFSQ